MYMELHRIGIFIIYLFSYNSWIGSRCQHTLVSVISSSHKTAVSHTSAATGDYYALPLTIIIAYLPLSNLVLVEKLLQIHEYCYGHF